MFFFVHSTQKTVTKLIIKSSIKYNQHFLNGNMYGNPIIFQVINIQHVRDPNKIPQNTLKQLNLLQKIIKQKDIEWEKVVKGSKHLTDKLKQTREMILEFMKYNQSTDEIDYLYIFII